MTIEEIGKDDDKFMDELRWLREKYPQHYIEAWGPYDYVLELPENSHKLCELEKLNQDVVDNWDHWIGVVEILHDTFDAHVGTNWDRLRGAILEIKRNASK
jgi:hypothetical protein